MQGQRSQPYMSTQSGSPESAGRAMPAPHNIPSLGGGSREEESMGLGGVFGRMESGDRRQGQERNSVQFQDDLRAAGPRQAWSSMTQGNPVEPAPAPGQFRLTESEVASQVRAWVKSDATKDTAYSIGPMAWHIEPHLPVPADWRGRPCGDCCLDRSLRKGGRWAGDPPARRRRRMSGGRRR